MFILAVQHTSNILVCRVREGLKNCEHGRFPIGPDHFPKYLWPASMNFQDNEALVELIFRSDWILKVSIYQWRIHH